MVMQTAPAVPAVTLDLGTQGSLPENAYVANEAKAGLFLRGDGALEGAAPINSGNTMPVIRNWDGDVVRTDLINNLLIDPGLQENQLMAVEQTVDRNGYVGVVLDYRGIDAVPSARADYVHLVSKLAERLHANNKTLAVRVEAPSQISADSWDTLGFDWSGLGAVVDRLIVPAPVDPMAYAPDGQMDDLLRFATSQVERRKLQIELPAQSVERSGNYLLPKGYAEALRPLLAQVISEGGNEQEIALSLDNPRLLSQVIWDEAIGMYYYTYIDDQGLERTVYIETAGSVAHKLDSLSDYNVRNVSIQTPATGDIDPNIWEVLLQFQQGGELSGVLNQLTVSYTLLDQAGNVVGQEVRPINNPRVVMAAPAVGELRVQTEILNASGRPLAVAPAAVVATGAAQPASEAAAADAEGEEATAAVDAPTLSSGQIVNVRQGPGTAYPVLGQINPGIAYDITGKNEPGDWWQIDLGGGTNGWGGLSTPAAIWSALAVVSPCRTPGGCCCRSRPRPPSKPAATPRRRPVAVAAPRPAAAVRSAMASRPCGAQRPSRPGDGHDPGHGFQLGQATGRMESV